MSYDIQLAPKDFGDEDEKQENYVDINITYNYAPMFYRVFGEKGIRTIYGMTGLQSIPFLLDAKSRIGYFTADLLWDATEDGIHTIMAKLLRMAETYPYWVWSGD